MTNGWTGGQYSVYRVLLGAWLLMKTAPMIASGDAVTAIGAVIAVPCCAALALGVLDRSAAHILYTFAIVITVWTASSAFTPFDAMGMAIAIGLPILHTATPPAPYGSLAARGRADPGNAWLKPPTTHAHAWVLLGAVHLVGAVWLVIESAAAPVLMVDRSPTEIGKVAILAPMWFAFIPLAAWSATRRWAWPACLAWDLVLLTILGHPGAAAALGVCFAATFNPAWLAARRPDEPEAIFYDGHCGLCHRWVRFVLAEDVDGERFVLSPLQGEWIAGKIPASQRDSLPDSIVVARADGAVLTRSAAILHILDTLGGLWRIAAWIGRAIPRPLRDAVYDAIARVRRRVFAQPAEACPIVPEHLRGRFRS